MESRWCWSDQKQYSTQSCNSIYVIVLSSSAGGKLQMWTSVNGSSSLLGNRCSTVLCWESQSFKWIKQYLLLKSCRNPGIYLVQRPLWFSDSPISHSLLLIKLQTLSLRCYINPLTLFSSLSSCLSVHS